MIEYRIAVGLFLLIYTSYLDIKRREVEDKPWVIFALIGVSFFVYEYVNSGIISDWFLVLISIGVTASVAFIFYYLGFYGGADAKALAALSFILPIFRSPIYLHPLAPLTVLTNAMVLVMGLPFYFLIRNLTSLIRGDNIFSDFEDERIWKKIVVLFIGYRLKNVKEDDFYLSLEKSVNGQRKFDLRLLKDEDVFLKGKDIWGTPGIPLLLFMAGGFVVMVLIGDLVAIFLNAIISTLISL